jgi:hypothetical protein
MSQQKQAEYAMEMKLAAVRRVRAGERGLAHLCGATEEAAPSLAFLAKGGHDAADSLVFDGGLAYSCATTNEAASPFAIFEGACPEPSRRVSTTGLAPCSSV